MWRCGAALPVACGVVPYLTPNDLSYSDGSLHLTVICGCPRYHFKSMAVRDGLATACAVVAVENYGKL